MTCDATNKRRETTDKLFGKNMVPPSITICPDEIEHNYALRKRDVDSGNWLGQYQKKNAHRIKRQHSPLQYLIPLSRPYNFSEYKFTGNL